MNRTGLFVLIAAAIVIAVGAFWYVSRSVTTQPASAPLVATDTSAAPPASADQPAEEATTPAAPPADALGGVIAPEPEAKDSTRGDADKAERRARTSHNDDAKQEQGYAAAPPPPPPPPPPKSSAVVAPSSTTRSEEIPLFPWPVPKASATQEVPRKLIIGNTSTPTFGSVAERIASALDHAGYGERSYYALAGGHGVAIATQIEQINDDGTPVVGVARFEQKAPLSIEQFSLTSYVKALFTARSGRFRIIVFTLSENVAQDNKPPSDDEAMTWPSAGQTHLPQRYALIPFTDRVTCTAFIYEFEKKDFNTSAAFVQPGEITGMSHLLKAGIWTLLGK